ncbi:MAG: PhnD/SsuA/transferrin family substrate-binding protein [Rhodoferax sp.]|nr:PhnD/SsuA/transferrin family substrate-binding protein [Rhodoferax sp.]
MRRRTLVEWGAALGLTRVGAGARAALPPLRIGLTAVILADQAAFLARWSEYLSLRLGVPVVFVARESYQSILDLLFSDQLDAAWICGYPYVRYQSQLQLLAVPVYRGKPLYQSYLIRTRGSAPDLKGWSDLKHRVLAYSDPLSNSGWLVAQAQLRAAGLSERDLRRTFFAHSHRNVAEAVATGLAQAGCIDGYVWETMQLQKMASVEKTEVIWKSEFYAFPPLVVRAGDRNGALSALGAALLAMQDDALGRDLLRALNLNGFSSAVPALFDSIKTLAASVSAART